MTNGPEVVTDSIKEWDDHWTSLQRKSSLFTWLSAATRRFIFQPALKHYTARFFPTFGTFVEMGCGTAQSSTAIARGGRILIGLDYSSMALRAAAQSRCFDALVQGDILSLPCRPASLDGIWNLGVMEHFSESQIDECLRGFYRVLKPEAAMILFWPPEGNASRWVLAPLEWIKTRLSKKPFTFFPDEINRLRSAKHAGALLEKHGFQVLAVEFSWRTAFIHTVVVGKRI
jgi:SAM-dependent methyltransferase